ncbi:hypothetical protein HMPREF9156_00338 [Scardovia wiggsiae F0424]|uniref:Septum formation initiator family protein n=1 Tax=Scardovia wiggsiae F0424 TaxID=857290 RepID=J0X160_9BIFI|nr:hypothetical protein HMPREF9156_00338 [Scardovia wiggsiae F0424]
MDTAGITDTGGSIAAEGQAGIFALRAKTAEKLCDSLLAGPLRQCDINEVERQLGRYPRGMVAVGARCVCGRPLVTVTRPLLDGKIPFPTTFYLTFPAAAKAISRVEASGKMAEFTALLQGEGSFGCSGSTGRSDDHGKPDGSLRSGGTGSTGNPGSPDPGIVQSYREAHKLYLIFRHHLAQKLGDSEGHISGISAGGMPERVKCLHALAAQSLVMGRGVNPFGDIVLDLIAGEFDPSVCRCSGHSIES